MTAHVAGDPAAFGQLYERYGQPLLKLMFRKHSLREEARDLVQQTFLQLHRARADYDSSRRFRPWLYAIALNLSREVRRRQFRRLQRDDTTGFMPLVAVDVAADDLQLARSVRAAVDALPGVEREVIELHWFDGLTFAEIAECLGIPANTARSRAHRGYEHLRLSLAHLID